MNDKFVFMTSVQAVKLTGIRASNLAELYEGIRSVDGSSIYHHEYRFLRLLHFLPDVPRSDFAYWINDNLNEAAVAEKISSLDLRSFSTIRDLRNEILSRIYSSKDDIGMKRWERPVVPGMEFHFCRSASIIMPTGFTAVSIEDFIKALAKIDIGSLFYHLIEAPLNRDEADYEFNNDFSCWIKSLTNMDAEANAIANLDPYTWDMETLRRKIIEILGKGKLRSIVKSVLERQDESEMSAIVKSILQSFKGDKSASDNTNEAK
jgi:hypothetical protein